MIELNGNEISYNMWTISSPSSVNIKEVYEITLIVSDNLETNFHYVSLNFSLPYSSICNLPPSVFIFPFIY